MNVDKNEKRKKKWFGLCFLISGMKMMSKRTKYYKVNIHLMPIHVKFSLILKLTIVLTSMNMPQTQNKLLQTKLLIIKSTIEWLNYQIILYKYQ